jgi:hypothetical protein
MGVLADEEAAYVRFHLEQVCCRFCLANLDDLRELQATSTGSDSKHRRRKYFETSAGYLSSGHRRAGPKS